MQDIVGRVIVRLGRAELSRCYEVAAHLIESQVLGFSVLAPFLDLYAVWLAQPLVRAPGLGQVCVIGPITGLRLFWGRGGV